MYRAALAVVVALAGSAACADQDDRPQTLQYVTEAILKPNCGQNVCHSSFSRAKGYAFDTVEAAQQSIAGSHLVNPGDTDTSLLYTVLVRKVKRMPYDAPLPNRDVELIRSWILGGAQGLETAP